MSSAGQGWTESIIVSQRSREIRYSPSIPWLPPDMMPAASAGGQVDPDGAALCARHGLDTASPWVFRRVRFPWGTARAPKMTDFTITLHREEECRNDFVCAMAIGGADGPTAIFVGGSTTEKIAVTPLTFAPPETTVWQPVFREVLTADMTVSVVI